MADLHSLFYRMSDEWPGICEMESDDGDTVVVMLASDGQVRARARLSRGPSTGVDVVGVEDQSRPSPVTVYVSPIASAVLAVMLR
jgi:hypothetical protein